MIDFESRKEKNIFNTIMQRDESTLNTEHTNILNDISTKYDIQIDNIWKEISKLQFQIFDIVNQMKNGSLNNENNNKNLKDEKIPNLDLNNIKNELFDYINKEIKIQLKENIEIVSLKKNLNQSNYNSNISNINRKKGNNSSINSDNETKNIKKQIQILNSEKSIASSKINNFNKNNFNGQIRLNNHNITNFNLKNISNIDIVDNNINEDDIIEKKHFFNQNDLNEIKQDIFQNFEKYNLKILNELKNQACDIKTLYEEIQNFTNKNFKNQLFTLNNDYNDINNELNRNIEEDLNIVNNNFNMKKISNLLCIIEEELSKKVDLEQLNYALNAQAKLNEAFASSCKICTLSWSSEDILINNKYIKWSMQNINTALDVFKWENNSEIITILQKGIYKIVVGLIDVDKNKIIRIIVGNKKIEKEKILFNCNINNHKSIINGKENLIFIEKYIACIENTEIKIDIGDENIKRDYSEEAFLQLKKII